MISVKVIEDGGIPMVLKAMAAYSDDQIIQDLGHNALIILAGAIGKH